MPDLDTYRKQAKQLVRWHRQRNYSIGERLRRLERHKATTDAEALAMKFPLTLAQEIIAAEAGHASWAALKAAVEAAPLAERPRRPEPGPPVVRGVTPILFVRDVAASAAFWRDTLGFTIDFLHGAPPFYGSVSRNGVCLHLRFVHRPIIDLPAARAEDVILASFEVTNVKALFEAFKAAGAKFPQTLTKQAWGGTDFYVEDLDGNVVSFVGY